MATGLIAALGLWAVGCFSSGANPSSSTGATDSGGGGAADQWSGTLVYSNQTGSSPPQGGFAASTGSVFIADAGVLQVVCLSASDGGCGQQLTIEVQTPQANGTYRVEPATFAAAQASVGYQDACGDGGTWVGASGTIQVIAVSASGLDYSVSMTLQSVLMTSEPADAGSFIVSGPLSGSEQGL